MTSTFAAHAEAPPSQAVIRSADAGNFAVAAVLADNLGRQVEVTVSTGATFRGKLAAVGAKAIHIEQLSGKEFYDAVIDRDAIVAVVLRMRDKL